MVETPPPHETGTSPALADSLRTSEEIFRAIFEEAGIGMALVNLEGFPVATNPVLQELLGYSDAELRGMNFAVFTHPDDVAADLELFQQAVAGTRQRYELAKRYLRRDGEVIHGQLTVSMVRAPDGTPRYAVGMIQDMTDRVRADHERRRLRAKLAAAHEEERRHLAHDLHDDPLQKLTAATIRLTSAGRGVDEEQRRRLDQVEELLEDAIASLRSLTFDLRPPVLDRQGLVEALEHHVRTIAEGAEWQEWEVRDTLTVMPSDEVAAAAYRIVYEAVVNAGKHARANRVTVTLESDPYALSATVADDGIGFDPGVLDEPTAHLGLSFMQERAELLSGSCDVRTSIGKGTTLRFRLPLEPA